MNAPWLSPRVLGRTCIALLAFEVLIGLFNLAYLKSDRLSNQGWLNRQEVGAVPTDPQSPPDPERLGLVLETKRLIKFQLDMDREGNVVTWFSSSLSLIAALAALALFATRRRGGWLAIGLGFLTLSMDEVAQFHEWIGIYLSKSGFTVGNLMAPYPWALFLGPLILGFGVWVLVFLYRVLASEGRLRRVALVSLAAMGAVIPFELIGAKIQGELPHPPRGLVILEETFEMLGITLFIFVLLTLLQQDTQGAAREPTQTS